MAIEVNSPNLWIPESKATLYRVPWDSGYENVVEAFKDVTYRDLYFANLTAQGESFVVSQNTYFRPGQPIDVPVPYDRAYTYNYLVVENPPQQATEDHADSTLKLYYFIVNADYASPQVTTLTLQLDVWTTYRWSCEFGAAYVERGHIGIANDQGRFDEGREVSGKRIRDYLSETEQLGTGDELVTYYQTTINLVTAGAGYIVVRSTLDLTADPGYVENPSLTMASGNTGDGIWDAQNMYCFSAENFSNFMSIMRDYSWVAQCITSIMYVPSYMIDSSSLAELNLFGLKDFTIYAFRTIKQGRTYSIPIVSWTDGVQDMLKTLPANSRDLYKLLAYPYTVVEFDLMQGSPLEIGLGQVAGSAVTINRTSCVTPPFAKMAFTVSDTLCETASDVDVPGYNATGDVTVTVDTGEWFNMSVWQQDYPQLPLLNDSYQLYMASNANRIQYQYDNIRASNQKTMASIDVSRQTQINSIVGSAENFTRDYANAVGRAQLDVINRGWDLGSAALSTVGSAASLNVGGIVGGLVDVARQASTMQLSTQQAANELSAMAANKTNDINVAHKNLDLNTSNAVWAANLDKQMAIKGILSTQADARNTPPSTVGMMGGNGFMLSLGFNALIMRVKHPNAGKLNQIIQYFRLYGYTINQYLNIPEDGLLVCENMSYWKCANVVIKNMEGDETARDSMRSILMRGVTVWANADIIGRKSAVMANPAIVKTYYMIGDLA